jgi:hypothetical protein
MTIHVISNASGLEQQKGLIGEPVIVEVLVPQTRSPVGAGLDVSKGLEPVEGERFHRIKAYDSADMLSSALESRGQSLQSPAHERVNFGHAAIQDAELGEEEIRAVFGGGMPGIQRRSRGKEDALQQGRASRQAPAKQGFLPLQEVSRLLPL